jgi:L-serine dehydratase
MAFISVFDLFKIGVGPSSSHTVGPMRAAGAFREGLDASGLLTDVGRIEAHLFGSLAHTGRGHHTDRAILWGLSGLEPRDFDPAAAERVLEEAWVHRRLWLHKDAAIAFDPNIDLVFDRDREVGLHPNEIAFRASSPSGQLLSTATFYSVGGGFIATPQDLMHNPMASIEERVPFPFRSADELLAMCRERNLSIEEVVAANERTVRSDVEIDREIDAIWDAMHGCIQRGLQLDGELPGELSVRRRAAALHRKLESGEKIMRGRSAPGPSDWVHCWAMSVNEENAAGGRVVTAPTNGAAGIIPAVLMYFFEFVREPDEDLRAACRKYFLTAGAVGVLFKRNASISGAEVGCQGEVGAASSMAAAGLTALLGGSPAQIEHAAEIAIEHHLGLTCDPIGGLVQVPCIERNGFGATKAISAARLAMMEDGSHRVSLDRAIETMRQTGLDMSSKYKETSLGGLAVSYIEC